MGEQYKQFRAAFEDVRKETESAEEYEKGEKKWPIDHSELLGNGSLSYDGRFKDLYPEEYKNIKQYIEERMKTKRGSVIGIDLGGHGSVLFSQFERGFIERSLGVTLVDRRDEITREEDTVDHHDVLPADIFSSAGNRRIKNWLRGRKADLIFEKMEGAIGSFPDNLDITAAVFRRWYQLLAENGIMFLQTQPLSPNMLGEMKRWLEKIKSPELAVTYKPVINIRKETRLYIVLEKRKGAPESLL